MAQRNFYDEDEIMYDKNEDTEQLNVLRNRLQELEKEQNKTEIHPQVQIPSHQAPPMFSGQAPRPAYPAASPVPIQTQVLPPPQEASLPQDNDTDTRSIYIGNVDYGTKPEELQKLFSPCGVIRRLKIMVDRLTGHPKGFAYMEFERKESVAKALRLSGTAFHGREIKVSEKRTNIPGHGYSTLYSRIQRPGRYPRRHFNRGHGRGRRPY